VAVGFVEDSGGAIVVAAGSPEADWARNLEVDSQCAFAIDGPLRPAVAQPLDASDHARAVRDLILKYGTPAEGLGRGPAFRIIPT
jgi:hypothetical protein